MRKFRRVEPRCAALGFSTLSRCGRGIFSLQLMDKQKNKRAVTVCLFAIFACLYGNPSFVSAESQSQAAPVGKPTQQLIECRSRFKMAEIRAQVPHQTKTMSEFCSTVEISCTELTDRGADCLNALARMERLLVSASNAFAGTSSVLR